MGGENNVKLLAPCNESQVHQHWDNKMISYSYTGVLLGNGMACNVSDHPGMFSEEKVTNKREKFETTEETHIAIWVWHAANI